MIPETSVGYITLFDNKEKRDRQLSFFFTFQMHEFRKQEKRHEKCKREESAYKIEHRRISVVHGILMYCTFKINLVSQCDFLAIWIMIASSRRSVSWSAREKTESKKIK